MKITFDKVKIGLKLFDLVTDYIISRKNKITYCPLCKTYRIKDAIWTGDPKDLEGKEFAKYICCEGCKNALNSAKIKININIEKQEE